MKNYFMCNSIYLDNGATSRYKPISSQIAIIKSNIRSANAGRGSHNDSLNFATTIEKCRNAVRQITFNGTVIFTKNCTEAINIALKGLNITGEVLTTMFEHNSILRTLHTLKAENKITLKTITPSSTKIDIADISPYISSKTKLVVMGETNNVTGVQHNIAGISRLCKERGVLLMLDTAQSLGHSSTDYKDVDILACSGHKGLHGPQGTGFLVLRDTIRLNPLICGGTGTDSLNPAQPTTMPEGFESGTLNGIGIAGLEKSILWTARHMHKINYKIEKLSQYLIDELSQVEGVTIYSKTTSGVVSFNIKNFDCMTVADILNNEFGIAVRAGLHCSPLTHKYLKTLPSGTVRVSIGYNNKKSHIKSLVTAIKYVIKCPNIGK